MQKWYSYQSYYLPGIEYITSASNIKYICITTSG